MVLHLAALKKSSKKNNELHIVRSITGSDDPSPVPLCDLTRVIHCIELHELRREVISSR